jgi:hypothetical protein
MEVARMTLLETIASYAPGCEQEAVDRLVMLSALGRGDKLLTRDNLTMHFTASAWITNPARTMVLMVYHNLYDSWAWTGGHADGEEGLRAVALREPRRKPARACALCAGGVLAGNADGQSPMKRGRFVPPICI